MPNHAQGNLRRQKKLGALLFADDLLNLDGQFAGNPLVESTLDRVLSSAPADGQ